MTIPKNKRRTIHVNNTEYEYCITGYASLYVKNTKTNKEYKKIYRWNFKDPKNESITPSEIKQLIIKRNL